MKRDSRLHRQLHLSVRLCTIVVALVHCGTKAEQGRLSSAPIGDAGAAGQAALLICGQPAELSLCDPVTAAPCDIGAGESCDYSIPHGAFKCFPGPNFGKPGQACDDVAIFCGPTTTCNVILSQCEHYCCSDADCAQGSCNPNQFMDGPVRVGGCTGEYGTERSPGASGAGNDDIAHAGGAGE